MSDKLPRNREKICIEKLQDLFDMAKIDYTDLSIGCHDNISLDYEFPITPNKYLKYAKSDLNEGSEKGFINALSNAKRSIDCLVESVLNSLNIDPNSISESANVFFEDVLSTSEKNIKPKSLKLFCALGFAPSILISEVRTLRNKIEHDYAIPDKAEVIKAIEVADLLLHNVKAKEVFSASIDISDCRTQNKAKELGGSISSLYFTESYFERENGKCKFVLEYLRDDWFYYTFTGDEVLYYYFLRAMFIASHDEDSLINTVKLMFKHLDIKTPSEYVKINQICM